MTDLFPDVRPLSKAAQNILEKRYFRQEETTWEQLVNRVVDFVLSDEKTEPKEITRQMILNRYFIPNSPCLVNANIPNSGLCACYVVDFPDTIEGIYKTKLDFALIARKGGGCGTSLSKIRPEGSKVAGSTHGHAGGPVRFADTISHDAEALTQAGFRSMAIMFVMDVYHPDIIKFITAKEEEGRISNANMSVMVDDAFMQKVENDETYWTEFNGIKYNEYKAKEIFNLIVEGAWRNGEPALLFKNRIQDSPYKYTGQEIFSTNPCLHKDTLLLNNTSLMSISDIEKNKKTWKTGMKKCILLKTNAGHEIILTPDHKIMLENESFVEAKDSLNKNIHWGLGNNFANIYPIWQTLGFLFGDGFLCGKKQGISVKIDKNKESEMFHKLIDFGFIEEDCGVLYINKKELENKINIKLDFLGNNSLDKKIPYDILTANSDILGSFISGLFEANGSVVKSSSQISFKSISKILVQQIQIILATFGIKSWIVKNKPSLIHWHNGDYTSKESYNLQIAPRMSNYFKKRIGFMSDQKNNKIKEFNKQYNQKLKITSIKNIEEPQEVWDFESTNGYCFANGLIAHNCSEQPLPPNGVCNLGSFDLSKYIDENKNIDFNKLELSTRLAVKFLDTVIDKSSYPTKEIEQWSKENRAIGVGIMGFSDYCLIKEIAYGSPESQEELEEILDFIYSIAEEESIKLGNELGIPMRCAMLPTPRRNVTLLTIAPTGTVSLIAGCSSGLEPIFSEITIRNDKTGTYTFENELASKPYFRCAVSSDGSQEVTWEEHIEILASAQKHIDSGVSKTINFPNGTHRETMAKAMIKAWKMGCKGIASYRNGSRKVEVLSPKNLKKDKCPACGSDLVNMAGCKKCLSCSWNLCEE